MGDESTEKGSGTESETKIETPGGTKISESEAPPAEDAPASE